jgi:nucleotide-binding universal stress UspA family protein
VDDSLAGRAAIRFAAAEAEETQQLLWLIRAWGPSEPHDKQDESQRLREERTEGIVDAMLTGAMMLVRQAHTTVDVHPRSIRRPPAEAPAEALVDASASAALLVVGSSSRRETEHTMLGPVSHGVLLNLAGPTVVVHGDDR